MPPQVTFLNHEAAPERSDIDDWFKEVTLFKRSPSAGGDSKHFGESEDSPAFVYFSRSL